MKKEKKSKKEILVGIISGVIGFLISYFAVQYFLKKDIEEELKNAAVELNKSTPIYVDTYTRLDSSSSKGKTNFIYYYTLLENTKAEVNLDTVNKYIRPDIIYNVKNNPDLKYFRQNNVTMDYRYYDQNGEFTLEISVTPEIYNN